jgi:siroheme synthase-like protein
MSAYPLVLEGTAITALVVGGGRVATRKALALLDAGARVHVLAPSIGPELEERAAADDRLRLTRAPYDPAHLSGSTLVVAATADGQTNAAIAEHARAQGKLVNVVDTPERGNCVTPAVHRSGDIVVSVTTGRVPGAAARIRDAIARTLDGRYAAAVRELTALRRRYLEQGDRVRWNEAASALVGSDFCEQVESGGFATRIAEWR